MTILELQCLHSLVILMEGKKIHHMEFYKVDHVKEVLYNIFFMKVEKKNNKFDVKWCVMIMCDVFCCEGVLCLMVEICNTD
jgi:hypothetical protein